MRPPNCQRHSTPNPVHTVFQRVLCPSHITRNRAFPLQKFRSTRSNVVLHVFFSPSAHTSWLHPCPSLPRSCFSPAADSRSSWPLRKTLRAGSHPFTHPDPPLHTVVTLLASPTHVPRSRPYPSAQGTAPLSHVPLGSRPRLVTRTVRFSGHVTIQWSRSHALAWRSRPHATSRPRSRSPLSPLSRPLITFLFPQPVHPLGSRSQSSDWGRGSWEHSWRGARTSEDRS